MEREDVFKTLVCPAWGLTSWYSKDAEQKNRLYGGNGSDSSTAAGAMVVMIILFLSVILTLGGIIKAFMCGSNPTNLGGSGFIWGLLGLFIPLPAIIFLFAGHCKVGDMS